jgi:L-ribulose-5-phosphate 4-epimerase
VNKYAGIREECLAANLLLSKTGLVDLTFGNVSVYDPTSGVFAIKPSGVPYEKLTADSIPVVDLDGDIVEGTYKPSSDTPTHRKLYASFGTKGVRAIVHTHSRSAVAFAQAGVEIPCLGTTHADYFHGAIPVTRTMTREEVAGDYEWETGVVIVEGFANLDPLEMPAALVRNHGPFAWGVSGAKAVECAQALEIVADGSLRTLSLSPLSIEAPQYLIDKHFYRKHGASAYYGQKF